MDIQSLYQQAIIFAAAKHQLQHQTIPGTDLPYVVHVSNVAMEILLASCQAKNFNAALAVQIALLHDVLEDTSATFEEIENRFGAEVAAGVLALTKNDGLPKEAKMPDSLKRISASQPEVRAVKLADRITNLQKPPAGWSREKKIAYREEAIEILRALQDTHPYLEQRLSQKIKEYETYI